MGLLELLDLRHTLARVGQTLDSTIHRTNHYPADKYQGNQLRYPLDRDLSSGYPYPPFEQLGPGLYWYHSVVYKRVKWVMPDLTSCKNALSNCLLPFFHKYAELHYCIIFRAAFCTSIKFTTCFSESKLRGAHMYASK